VIRFQVDLHERQAHRVHIRADIETAAGEPLEVSMPVWTPGSYLVREFARHVLDFRASAPDGSALPTRKLNKNTWLIEPAGLPTIRLSYALHANERSVRTNHVDATHAFLSPAATFVRVRGRENDVQRIDFRLPPGWSAFTALEERDGGFYARDYDALVDSPIEIGPHECQDFDHEGVRHRVVLAGRHDLDAERLLHDVHRIVAEVASVFGMMPFARYTFLLLFVDEGGGGLEHLDSCVCMSSRWRLRTPDAYRDYLSLLAHEYFHAWNVKRLRPVALGPFDYDREVYTRDLWVAEGITSYYDDLCTLRAGFFDKVGDYLSARAQACRAEAERPGARRMSLADASHDAWIKFYRPDDNTSNSSVSYYAKGALVALMLDLRIRRLSRGKATLADALRTGWDRHAARGAGYPEGAVEEWASAAAGTDLGDFFERHVHGTEPLAPDADLAWVGLRLAEEPARSKRALPRDSQGFLLEPWIGANLKASNGFARVDCVLEGSPAWEAGIHHDDLIVAVDDMRVDETTLEDRLERANGHAVLVTLLRGQTLHRLRVKPVPRRLSEWKLLPVDGLTEAQRRAFQVWTGQPHPARGEPAS